jgi:hypothetical protein
MVFTTHFAQHSQAMRLFEDALHRSGQWIKNGILTLSDALFQGTYTHAAPKSASLNYNSHGEPVRFQNWTVPASLAVTRGIPVGFFSSAY